MTLTQVLSAVGPGRCGTTILGNIPDTVQRMPNAGEMRWVAAAAR
jgi:hypothetical protein